MRRQGLTLIEMVAALAITAMLAVATLAVLRTLVRTGKVEQALGAQSAIRLPLRQVITNDLLQAQEFQSSDRGVIVRAMSSLNGDMERGHLPAMVQYEVRNLAGHNWLVRIQRPEVKMQGSTELVCSGVGAISVEPVLPPETDEKALAEPPPGDAGGWQKMPGGLSVLVIFDDGREPLQFVVRKGVS